MDRERDFDADTQSFALITRLWSGFGSNALTSRCLLLAEQPPAGDVFEKTGRGVAEASGGSDLFTKD